MATESLNEFTRGIEIAEAVVARYPHGAQRDAVMMKLSEVRAIAQSLMGDTIAVPDAGMACRMS